MTCLPDPLEIFLVATPGLEAVLGAEAREKGFTSAKTVPGGVQFSGNWADVWRANLQVRGASRVLVRLDSFRAMHLAQLDKRARKLSWGDWLRRDVPVRVEASCRKSRIYHSGAAAQRIAAAIHETLGVPIAEDAPIVIKARIEDDLCTVSVDSSGEMLHKRGHKEAVNRAPLRETMAALVLRACGFNGQEPVLDPMCGSGTFVIEAAEMALALQPGRSRAFAFEHLAGFDRAAFEGLRQEEATGSLPESVRFYGRDRDAGAIRMSGENAERAGVEACCDFRLGAINELTAPPGPPGLVVVNPPYGARIGERGKLVPLYASLGRVLRDGFAGWRVGIVASETRLVQATGLPFLPQPLIFLHGGIRVALHQTGVL